MGKKYIKHIIIGAGPAGLQLGYYFEKNKEDYLILERSDAAGAFFKTFPIHRQLISINKTEVESDYGVDLKEFAYRHDWNSLICDEEKLRFKHYSKDYFPNADVICEYLKDFAEHYQLNITYNSDVEHVSENESKSKEKFLLDTRSGQYTCTYLMIATGVSQPYIPKLEGIEHIIGYEEFDQHDFANQRVAIIGNGNSALETADALKDKAMYIAVVGHRPPKFAWDSHFVGNVRAVNNNFYDTYQLKSMAMTYDLMGIKCEKLGNGQYLIRGIPYVFDKVIRCTGFTFDFSILDKKLAIDSFKTKFPKINADFSAPKHENLFFCGTITQSLDYKKCTLGFIHGFRYSAKFIYDQIKLKDQDKPLEFLTIDKDFAKLSLFIAKEISENSCIWQLFSFWGLLIVIEDDHFKVYKNLPIQWMKENKWLYEGNDICIVSLEYGFKEGDDVFEFFPTFSVFNGYISKFIHPVIRYYNKNSYPFDKESLVQCMCGCWEDLEFMKHTTLCRSCVEKAFCARCKRLEDIDYLFRYQQCKKCNAGKKPKAFIRYHPYEAYKNKGTAMAVRVKDGKALSVDKVYEVHLMEDLLGRYYAEIHHDDAKSVEGHMGINANIDGLADDDVKLQRHLDVIHRYFDAIFAQQNIDMTIEVALSSKANRPISFQR